jgi:transposase InsO family protein
MLTMKDEYTGYTWVRFLRKKKQAASQIQSFFSFVERQFGVKIQTLRTDRGGEFLGSDFVAWLDQLGVRHQLTVPYTPQQNGVCERYNRTLCGRGHVAGSWTA